MPAEEGPADHQLFIELRGQPATQEIWSVAADGRSPGQRLGTTPFVLPVELRWGRTWRGRQWPALQVAAPGQAVVGAYDPQTRRHTLILDLIARAPGHEPARLRRTLRVLEPDGWDWAKETQFPSKLALQSELRARPAEPVATPAPPPRIWLVEGAAPPPEATGLLTAPFAAPDLELWINNRLMGRPPLEILAPAGAYRVGWQRGTERLGETTVRLEAGETVVLRAP
ncbi:MAG: hypothetical protein K9N49_07955 [Candidatus Marinimicrobia bacterium]|nr:hypothetical protein [Candidatus Neomarinimicrobiota bacterium]